MRVVAALDKFRGTATAREATDAVARAASTAGWSCDAVPMADGGEGTLDALGATTTRRRLGWRFWYGNPIAATSLVTAMKPLS